MAIFTIREFGNKIGREPKQVHTLISRGKLQKSKDENKNTSYIDTSILINKVYLQENEVVEKENKKVEDNQTEVKIEKQKPTATKKTKEIVDVVPQISEKSKVELAIKKKDLERKELELKEKQKKLVNLEMTIQTVKDYSLSFKKNLSQELQTFISDICARHGVDSAKAGKYKLRVNDIINNSSKLAIDQFNRKMQ